MELEFFCKPGEELTWFDYWKNFAEQWLHSLGLNKENLRLRDHSEDELSHYSNATTDFEYKFPFGWGELWGVASRTDYDLKQHMQFSGEDFNYIDPETNERYIPFCIEPSLGADRVTLAFLIDAYDEEQLEDGTSRTVMHFHPALAPFKAAVLPLSKKLSEEAKEVFQTLAKHFSVDYDEAGSIGKRYRRHDEIGTPFCITYDFDSKEDNMVTIRDRDTMEQTRVPIAELVTFIQRKIML
jgi:glycyl-tRNA synthetase